LLTGRQGFGNLVGHFWALLQGLTDLAGLFKAQN